MIRVSLALRLAAAIAISCVVTALLSRHGVVLAAVAGGGVGALLGWLAVRRASLFLRGFSDGLLAYAERDFAVRLASSRKDDLGQVAELFNRLGEVLRRDRNEGFQKETVMSGVLESAPTIIVLTDPVMRVVFANKLARELLGDGKSLEGQRFDAILARCPEELRLALAGGGDALAVVEQTEGQETYHATQRHFDISGQRHTLYLIQRLTRELSRQEVEVWKKVIRLISHELNNSLAPISSLLHSARLILKSPEHAHRLEGVFATVDDRITHLRAFLEGYAQFARLPRPRREQVPWPKLVASLEGLYPFHVEGALPERPGDLDPGQLQQVLVNLLKNASEAGSAPEDIALRVDALPPGGFRIDVTDRGKGMSPEVLALALVPFYSTKPRGTGLGLPLCREILEAHGGTLRIEAREGGGTRVSCFLPEARATMSP